jgi:hypothetical protein
MASSTPTPEQVTLNLDTLEREQVRGVPKPKAKPFTITFEEKVLAFEDPAEIDAAILMRMEETPHRFFRAALDDEGFNHVMLQFETPGKLPGWKLQAILQGYQDYYGVDGQGNVRGSRR